MYEQMAGQMVRTMHSSARSRACRGQLKSAITGKPNSLLLLSEVDASCDVGARRHAGVRTVQIDQIRGSESRCKDFDREFYPLQDHTAGRWRNIAQAREQGKSLPPVDLVQVGDVYFVLDGHHRISVARTLGQMAIDAKVTEWQVEGMLPWERTEGPKQKTGASQFFRRISETGARVRDRALMGVRSFVPA
jgi:hypothetical protein